MACTRLLTAKVRSRLMTATPATPSWRRAAAPSWTSSRPRGRNSNTRVTKWKEAAMIAIPAGCKAPLKHLSFMRITLVLLAWSGLGLLSGLAADKSPNSACLECHSDKTLTKTNAAGKEVSLFVDEARLKATVHQTNSCADCHADITRSEEHTS